MELFNLPWTRNRVAILEKSHRILADGTSEPPRELLKIDVTTSEDHTLEASATEHEVEDGFVVSDHVIKKPRTVTISGVISDDPIDLYQMAIGNTAGFIGSMFDDRIAGAVVTGMASKLGSSLLRGSSKPSKTAYDVLTSIYENNVLLVIITGIGTYNDMIMERLSIPRSTRTAESLEFTASFKQIRIAYTELVALPEGFNKQRMQKKIKGGTNPSSKTTAEIEGKAKPRASLLSRITGLKGAS